MHDKIKSRSRRAIPPVNKVLELLGQLDLPRPLVVGLVRRELSQLRKSRVIPPLDAILERIQQSIEQLLSRRLQPVINGTGVIVHTNFGRAPLAAIARRAVVDAAGYTNLEYDLVSGGRGERGNYLEQALAQLCGAEAATVVNNCAAALFLVGYHFANAKLDRLKRSSSRAAVAEIVISRGELVQIGGGFRIGEILDASGAKVREVGATNKTDLADYVRAISKNTALILKVHRSNFFMSGFVDSPTSKEIATLARKKRVPFVEDLGSGATIPTETIGLHEHEPTPNESIRDGADLVCFSGDKLFGGPQAGIIAGRKQFVVPLKREPIFRALRCDKLVFAALQATVDLHLSGSGSEIPVLALLQGAKDELRARAAAMLDRLRGLPLQLSIGRGAGKIGGGALPKSVLSSVTIDLLPQNCSVAQFAYLLRRHSPAVVGYISNGRYKLDLRTIFPDQDDLVIDAIRATATTTLQEDALSEKSSA